MKKNISAALSEYVIVLTTCVSKTIESLIIRHTNLLTPRIDFKLLIIFLHVISYFTKTKTAILLATMIISSVTVQNLKKNSKTLLLLS